ncbi:antirestriction protein [Henriciella algicola]|uniref:Antirestriction protein n=1 Tax=Henriciella algicola TaxID=1608422 RepID=A0A399RM31_9PROT|nr:antirestriction protein [Henriciella algicola]RIJ31047.1 antirestriction protein [Henriciella algicola]
MSTDIITARLIPLSEREGFLPKHAGGTFIRYEMLTYALMDNACESYGGGLWRFYELSNGGFFMAPDIEETLDLVWPDNFFEGSMSAEAAGIGISLMAQSQMAFIADSQRFSESFHKLRDYALDHTEAGVIFRFID